MGRGSFGAFAVLEQKGWPKSTLGQELISIFKYTLGQDPDRPKTKKIQNNPPIWDAW